MPIPDWFRSVPWPTNIARLVPMPCGPHLIQPVGERRHIRTGAVLAERDRRDAHRQEVLHLRRLERIAVRVQVDETRGRQYGRQRR